MSQGCGVRQATVWSLRLESAFRSHARSQRPPFRSNSSISEQSRTPRATSQPFVAKPWQHRFILGVGIGLTTVVAWMYYDHQQARGSFVTYKIVRKEPVSSTASIFHLAPAETSKDYDLYREAWQKGIWNVHFKQPQLQIVRAYTPLPPRDDDGTQPTQNLRFLIRHDPHGEVSSYLHRLPVGADIEMRGPNLEYSLTPDIHQVVFFAGGTGIAPALQIAHAMFDANSDQGSGSDGGSRKNRKLHILWASRQREDCVGGVSDAPSDDPQPPKRTWSGLFAAPKPKAPPATPVDQGKGLLVQELEQLKQKYPNQVTVEYFVNTEGTWIDNDVVFRTLSRFDDKDFSSGTPSSSEQRQILISGPNGFITYLAGPKEWRNGREEQGYVGNIVAHAIAQNPHHVKVWKV